MKHTKRAILIMTLGCIPALIPGQESQLSNQIQETMLKATRFMVEEVSYNGGFLWYYLPDFSRRWGEMEAYRTMIWMQNPGTIDMGNVFLDAYHATGNEYYYRAAEKAANAIIWGQGKEGGWNYMIDFAGDRSLRKWYSTIGKNGWRLEEFQHYYGNSTFDDGVTSGAARFLLRIYLEKMDPAYRPSLDKAIDFILKSQYLSGGWPQRYPLRHDFSKNGRPDYSSYTTFNDEVTEANIRFLILCYLALGKEEYLDPIKRGMDCFLVSQHRSGGWGEQYDAQMEPAGARSYEPRALLPSTTFRNAMALLDFYEMTGERKYLAHVPAAIKWLEETKLPESKTEKGRYTHPTFIDPDTNLPVYVHRKGSNVVYGYYYTDERDNKLLCHYGGKTSIPIHRISQRYESLASLDPALVALDSPLRPGEFKGERSPQQQYLKPGKERGAPEADQVEEIIQSLDDRGRWLTTKVMTSHPYAGDGTRTEPTEAYASTFAGDETDTSPYKDTSGQDYIATWLYIQNMRALIRTLEN